MDVASLCFANNCYNDLINLIVFVNVVSDLDLPKETDECVENVDSEAFWRQCNQGIIHRGILRGNPYEAVALCFRPALNMHALS